MPEDEDSAGARRENAPTTAQLTACEAITWIALGEAKSAGRLHADRLEQALLWGTTKLEALDLALAATANRACYEPNDDRPWRFTEHDLSAVKERIAARLGREVSNVEMLAMLRTDMAQNARTNSAMDDAARELIEAVRAGRVGAYGRPTEGALHVEIPAAGVMGDAVEITLSGQIIGTDDAKLQTLYSDVRLNTIETLARWPASGMSTTGTMVRGRVSETEKWQNDSTHKAASHELTAEAVEAAQGPCAIGGEQGSYEHVKARPTISDEPRSPATYVQPNDGAARRQGAIPAARNRRGPRPIKRAEIAHKMQSEYGDSLGRLQAEKEEFLAVKYDASRDTVRKARRQVLDGKFQQNPDK